MHDDQFTATGPSLVGSGFPRSAFSSKASDMVYGVNVQGARCGVYGESVAVSSGRESAHEGIGVYGFGENFALMGNGNRGLAGVYGHNNRGRLGVIGATMRGGTGVMGASLRNLGNALDTFARPPGPADGGDGVGVRGVSGAGYGVLGESQDNVGLVGRSGRSTGVWGTAAGGGGYGVLGEGVDNAGAVGRSSTSAGVWGTGNWGVLGTANDSRDALAGLFQGSVVVQGDLRVTGTKAAAVVHPDGSHRILCAIESPESWFEDFGEAVVRGGRAHVDLDTDFAALATTADGTYQVFLTPYGDTTGLYVAQRTATGFAVAEAQGGTGDVPFGYRVVARRADVAPGRLARIAMPEAAPAGAAVVPAADALPNPVSTRP